MAFTTGVCQPTESEFLKVDLLTEADNLGNPMNQSCLMLDGYV